MSLPFLHREHGTRGRVCKSFYNRLAVNGEAVDKAQMSMEDWCGPTLPKNDQNVEGTL